MIHGWEVMLKTITLIGLAVLLLILAPDRGHASQIVVTDYDEALKQADCTWKWTCCPRLNRFMKNRVMKDMRFYDSGNWKFTKGFTCPSPQSHMAEAFQIILRLSRSNASRTNYYGWMKKIMKEKEFAFTLQTLPDTFAETNAASQSVILSTAHVYAPWHYAASLIHEVAHVKTGYEHVECRNEKYKGKKSCDDGFQFTGIESDKPFSVEFQFLRDYLKSRTSRKHRWLVKLRMKANYEDLINDPPEFGPDGKIPFSKYYGFN